jgi:3'-phosphoadenosine 5'-phosphosulfate sulfotransferase (PAPS reductase)/FAD synthetase
LAISEAAQSTELLRLVTCGSVDDGKSTLIGRLLYDTKQIFVDQLEHIEDVSRRRGNEYVERMEGEDTFTTSVRFRTVGDMTCTGGVESTASTIDAVVEEIAATRVTERGETRADDRFSEAAMEDRKRVGYF